MKKNLLCAGVALALFALSGCEEVRNDDSPKNKSGPKYVVFFLGDGMGTSTLTASRIYGHGEDGQLTMDKLPETAWIRTYSNDAQVTDSAPSMAAYMTGVKMNNEVISMSADTQAVVPGESNTKNNCGSDNGKAVPALFELAKKNRMSVGAVTSTRVTHATPAATYAHICHRDLENDIAAQLVPGGKNYNKALGDGVDVLFGGGRKHFLASANGGARTDGRDLTFELQGKGYHYVKDVAGFKAIDTINQHKVIGLFTNSHMSFELDRDAAKEPSLSQMTEKAIAILRDNPNGFALMVEGGRIDHALHGSNAARALHDTIAFDNAIKTALEKMQIIDPGLKNTLVVVTADHDHTLILNGYAQRTGKTTATNPGVLGLVKNVTTGEAELDEDGMPYTVIGFGNGENRVAGARNAVPALTDAVVAHKDYHQEAAVLMSVGNETHGGTDVPLMAVGLNADRFHGFMNNTEVFAILQDTLLNP